LSSSNSLASAEQRRKELTRQDGKPAGNRLYRGDDFVGLRRARQDSSRPCIECIEAVVLAGSLNKDYECRLIAPDSPMANRSSGGTSAKTTFT